MMHASAAVIISQPEGACAPIPDGSNHPSASRRIRDGISIATGSLKAMIHDRQLFWFSFMAGLVLLFLIAAVGWTNTHLESALLYSFTAGSDFLVIDLRLLFLEMICLSCFTLILAGLVLHRHATAEKRPVPVRDSFSRINSHTNSLLGLSLGMAVVATLVYLILTGTQLFGKIVFTISMAVFYMPYSYYFPNELYSALSFSTINIVSNSLVLLVTLYVVPEIVLGQKRLLPALAGAAGRISKTWCEMIGCLLVAGAIVLGVFTIALLIGQSPLLLNHDYDFFLQVSRGQILMTVACYGFVLACWSLLAFGITAAGVAMTDMCTGTRVGDSP
ncbi:MAG: hypothetical protein GYA23_06050 [Methanomicrobiales archaeon]|nr:hypothetical protein [Methanomicrobiales archaeon]